MTIYRKIRLKGRDTVVIGNNTKVRGFKNHFIAKQLDIIASSSNGSGGELEKMGY